MEQSDNKYLNKLYRTLSKDYDIKDFDELSGELADDNKRKTWYDAIKGV